MSEAKEFLRQYQKAFLESRHIQDQIEILVEKKDQLSQAFDQERVQASMNTDRIGELVAKISDLQLDLMDALATQLSVMLEVKEVIGNVQDEKLRLLLHYRYIALYKWSYIADLMDYQPRGVYKAHQRALKEVEKLLN